MPREDGQFKKGKSGNPKGRPAEYAEFRKQCRERTPQALKALEDALADDDRAVAAAKVLLEFGWGKPSQSLTFEDGEGHAAALSVVVQTLPPEE